MSSHQTGDQVDASLYQIHYAVSRVEVHFEYPEGNDELSFILNVSWQDPNTGVWYDSTGGYDEDEWTQGGVDLLGKLQAVHDGGVFRNGQSMTSPVVEPTVYWDGQTHNLSDWEERGGFNPLDMDGLNKYRTGQKFTGRFAQEGAVQSDGLELTTGFEVKPSRHTGGTVALNEIVVDTHQRVTATAFTATPTTYQSFSLTIDIEEYQRITLAELHNYPPVAALVGLLNDRRQNPNTMPAITGVQGAYSFGNPRTHRFFVKNINNTDAFKIFFYQTAKQVPNGYVTQLQIFGLVDPDDTDDYSHDTLQRDLNRISRHVPAETVYTQNPFGVRETNFKARQIQLNDTTTIESVNGIARYRVKNPGSQVNRLIPIGSTGVIDFDDLDVVNGPNGMEARRLMKTPYEAPLAHVIHHYGSEDKVLQIINPEQANGHNGSETPLKVENQGAGTLRVIDWNEDIIVDLRPKESAEFAFVFDDTGYSRVIGDLPERYFSAAEGTLGNLGEYGYYDFDANHWARPVKLPASNDIDIDNDAFAIGSLTNVGGGRAWSAAEVQKSRDVFEVSKAGTMVFNQSVLFTVVGSGNLGASLTKVFRKRGDTLTLVDELSYSEISGNGSTKTFRWSFRGRVEAGDIFIPLIVYPKGTTLNIATSTLIDFFRTVTLDPVLSIEYEQEAPVDPQP